MNDIQLLRQAALDIQYNQHDYVKIAGVVQRLKNWWKARFDSDFKERADNVEDAYNEMKEPLVDLIKRLQQLDQSFKGQDPDTVAKLVGEIPGVISQVTKDMNRLSRKMRAADAVIPITYVDEEGKELSTDNTRWVAKNYKQNRELIEELWNNLPKEMRDEIPIGKIINQPISNYSWYKNYNPSDIIFSSTVIDNIKKRLSESLLRSGFDSEAVSKILENGFKDFIINLRKAILEQGILVQVNFPNISKKISHRRANEMLVEVNPGDVAIPWMGTDIWISVGKVLMHDLGASVNAVKQLSVFMITYIKISTYSYERLLQLKQKKEEEEKKKKETELQNIEPILTESSEDGPITKIVKRALIRERVPVTEAVININSQTFHHKVRFAKILSSALREEVNAYSSIRHNKDDIQLQTSINGSKTTSLNVLHSIASYIAEEFQKATSVGVDIELNPGRSSYKLIESNVLDDSFRKVVFDCWSIK